jgi:hypothetical protein
VVLLCTDTLPAPPTRHGAALTWQLELVRALQLAVGLEAPRHELVVAGLQIRSTFQIKYELPSCQHVEGNLDLRPESSWNQVLATNDMLKLTEHLCFVLMITDDGV